MYILFLIIKKCFFNIYQKVFNQMFKKNEETSIANSLENLQPLWAFENLSKGDKYE
jgi:hypothetical protein